MTDVSRDGKFVTWTPRRLHGHAISDVSFDVSSLHDGRRAFNNARPFTGRPELARALLPPLQECASSKGLQRQSFAAMFQDLTTFFRFLDEMEHAAQGEDCTFHVPNSAVEVHGHVWSLFTQWLSTEGDRRAHFIYSTCRRLFSMAAENECPDAETGHFLPPNPFASPKKLASRGGAESLDESDLTLEDFRAINRALRQQVEGTISRLQDSELVLKGELERRRAVCPKCCWDHRFHHLEQTMSVISDEVEQTGFYPRNLTVREVCFRAGLPRAEKYGNDRQQQIMRSRLVDFVASQKGNYKVIATNESYEWHIWGDALPELYDLGTKLGWQLADWKRGSGTYYTFENAAPATVSQIIRGLHAFVPRKDDLLAALALLLQQTGWNVSTGVDLNIRDWWKPHPTHPNHVVKMYAPKGRARGAMQPAFSLRKKRLRPFDLVNRVLKWTAPLRDSILHELAQVTELLSHQPAHKVLRTRKIKLEALSTRLWLYLDLEGNITGLKKADLRWSWVNEIIRQALPSRASDKAIAFSQELTRKAYACFVYETSGYNLIVTQVALGHKDFASLITYLERKRIKRRNRRAWFDLQCSLLDGLGQGAVLRAVLAKQIRKGSITEKEIELLESRSSLTRQGFLCTNPFDPDVQADPGHREGEICKEQRCLSGCSKAFATWDTAQWIALHILELRRRRELTPVPLWHESDDDLDLNIAEALLARYTEENQARALAWGRTMLERRGYQVTLPSSATMRLAAE